MKGQTDGQTDEKQTDRETNRQMDGRTDIWTGKQTDGRTCIYFMEMSPKLRCQLMGQINTPLQRYKNVLPHFFKVFSMLRMPVPMKTIVEIV